MKRIILVFLGLFSLLYSFGQGSPTGAKTQFKNGVALGSKDSSSFTANDSLFLTIDRNNRLMWRGNGASSRWYVIPFTNGSDTLPDTRWVRLQTGNLFRQTGKMWISDTIRTSGLVMADSIIGNTGMRTDGAIKLSNTQSVIWGTNGPLITGNTTTRNMAFNSSLTMENFRIDSFNRVLVNTTFGSILAKDSAVRQVIRGNQSLFRNKPSYTQYQNTSQAGNGLIRAYFGQIGNPEAVMSHNMQYQDQVHYFDDSTRSALWLALSSSGFFLQYMPPTGSNTGDQWTATGSKQLGSADSTGKWGLNNNADTSYGDGLLYIKRYTNMPTIVGGGDGVPDTLVLEGGRIKGRVAPIYLNKYNTGDIYANGGGTLRAGAITSNGNNVLTTANVSGTTNTFPIFTATNTIGDGNIKQTSGRIQINGAADDGLSELRLTGDFRWSGDTYAPDGSAANAAYRFFNSPSGMYYPGSDGLAFTTNTVKRAEVTSAGHWDFQTGTVRIGSRLFGKSLNLDKDSVATSSAGSVLPLGIDTATGNVIKLPNSSYATSGTYTPTISATTNITSSSVNQFRFTRVGSVVTVYGSVNIEATATGATSFKFTLPISSTLGAYDLTGNGVNTLRDVSFIFTDTIDNTKGLAQYNASVSGSTYTMLINFSYTIN